MIIFVSASLERLVLILACACPRYEHALALCLVCSDAHKWLTGRTPCWEPYPATRLVRKRGDDDAEQHADAATKAQWFRRPNDHSKGPERRTALAAEFVTTWSDRDTRLAP
jgi:hypothetical protein